MSDSDRTVFMPRTGLSVGTRLNGIYEIERLIATGGMGEVYKGRAIQTGDAVAIKMVRPDMAQDEAVVTLFRKEAAALHNLYNEAIVRYYVFTVDPATQATYLAMEFVDGQPLSDRLKQGPLPFEEVELLRRRIATGLHAAHLLGITHRDVSPDNIILPGGQVARAKIIDFGIAKSSLMGEKTVIGSGFAGKYNYVSPEQLGLHGGEVTGKSDIYSLGLVLAEALGGRPLDMGGTQMQILEKRRRVPDLGAIDPRIRPLLTRMLAPDPAARPADMAEVAAWQPKGKGSTGGALPWRAIAGVAGLAILAGGGFLGWQALDGGGTKPAGGEAPTLSAARTDPPPLLPAGRQPPPPELNAADPTPPPAATQQSAREEPQNPVQTQPPAQPPGGTFASGRQEPPQPPAQLPVPTPPPAALSPQNAGKVDPGPTLTPPPAQTPSVQTPAAPPKNAGRTEPTPTPAPPAQTPVAPPAQTATNTTNPVQRPEPEPRTAAERTERYVANYDGGACFFLWPTSIADKRAMIEGFGSSAEPFVSFDAAFKKAQGFEAQISLRSVTTAQCPMVDFLRQLGRGIDRSPVMQIGAFTMKSGDTLSGTVESDARQNLDVLLIGDDGLVYNLANYTRRDGGKASFSLKLESTGASGPAVRPQTVIALVSPSPLPSLSGPNPAPAGDVFPGLRQDIARAGGKVGLGIKYFRIE